MIQLLGIYPKELKIGSWDAYMAQVVEHLPSKFKALSIAKKEK
jgi:hypothetical protein